MSDANKVMCSHCGGKVAIPQGHTRAKIRCSACGYYAEVPPNLRSSEEPQDELPTIQPKKSPDDTLEEIDDAIPSYFDKDEPVRPRKPQRQWGDPEPDPTPVPTPKKPKVVARPNPNPKDIRPDFQVSDDSPRGPNLIDGTQEEHDDQAIPYTVPGDGMKRCPDCGTNLPYESKLCVHCGVEFSSKKKKKKKTFETISREWEPRLDLQTRLKIFGGLQAFNLFFIFVIKSATNIDYALFVFILIGSLQAFILGSFEKISVFRNTKGHTTLTKIWRIAFIPLAPAEMKWKERNGVNVITGHTMGCVEWFTFACLLLLLIVPGVLFYIFVLHPVRHNIVLCDLYGSTEERLFTTTEEDRAHEICEVISTATGLTNRAGH